LDADRRRAYADIDDELFDTAQIPLTSRDVRSVGELLFDVDHTARQLLMDVAGDDAGRLLHAWPTVVTAAADLWSTLPGQKTGAGAHDRDKPITRLVSLADAIGTSLRNSSWPPASRPDPRMTQMAKNLGHAGDLVRRYGSDIPIERTESHRDLDATRARIMHALYVTAHAVGVSLHQHGRTRYRDARGTGRPLELSRTHSPYAVPPTTEWIRRMAVSEAAASRYLGGRFTEALVGEAVRPVEDDSRIARALAGWDIQAHRVLASNGWPANVLLITRTQGLIAGAAVVLVDAPGRRPPRALRPARTGDRRRRRSVEQPGQPLGRPDSPGRPAQPRADARRRRSARRLPRAHPRHHHHGQPRRHRHQGGSIVRNRRDPACPGVRFRDCIRRRRKVLRARTQRTCSCTFDPCQQRHRSWGGRG
jgi:hypothetical protein